MYAPKKLGRCWHIGQSPEYVSDQERSQEIFLKIISERGLTIAAEAVETLFQNSIRWLELARHL
jgi:hypothetical protein